MINEFYDALLNAEAWFFGRLIHDPFFSGVIDIMNAILLVSMFYGIIILPLKWAVSLLTKWLKGGILDDET